MQEIVITSGGFSESCEIVTENPNGKYLGYSRCDPSQDASDHHPKAFPTQSVSFTADRRYSYPEQRFFQAQTQKLKNIEKLVFFQSSWYLSLDISSSCLRRWQNTCRLLGRQSKWFWNHIWNTAPKCFIHGSWSNNLYAAYAVYLRKIQQMIKQLGCFCNSCNQTNTVGAWHIIYLYIYT